MNKKSTVTYESGASCPLSIHISRVRGQHIAALAFGNTGESPRTTHRAVTPAALREVISVMAAALAEWDDAVQA